MYLGSGLEAIAFQRTRPLFVALTAEIKLIMKKLADDKITRVDTTTLSKSNLSNILSAGTGFDKITIIIDNDAPINAYTIMPALNANHAFYNEWRRQMSGHGDAYLLYTKTRDMIKGQIDLATGMVSGDFAKVPIVIGLGWGLFDPKYEFLAEEIAAILLHEQGHDFTYFFAIHYTCATNMVLASGVQAIVNAEDTKQKYVLMADVENSLGIRIDNQNELTNYNNYENYYITILSAYREKVYSSLGSTSYDLTMCEQIADMYCARHGAGKYMVSGLARMDKLTAKRKRPFIISLIRFAWRLPIDVFKVRKLPKVIMGILTNDFIGQTYDDDKDRIIRIRNESIAALKEPTLMPAEKEALLDDISAIDDILKETSNADWSFSRKAAFLLRASQRKEFRSKRLQQELEALLNNPLYVSAAKYTL